VFHSPSAIETSIMPSSNIFLYLTINSKRKPLLFITNKQVVVMMQNTAQKKKTRNIYLPFYDMDVPSTWAKPQLQ
jgi:hypothetical protein